MSKYPPRADGIIMPPPTYVTEASLDQWREDRRKEYPFQVKTPVYLHVVAVQGKMGLDHPFVMVPYRTRGYALWCFKDNVAASLFRALYRKVVIRD